MAIFFCFYLKMVHFAPTKGNAEETARLVVHNSVRLHGPPETIVVDSNESVREFWEYAKQPIPAPLHNIGVATTRNASRVAASQEDPWPPHLRATTRKPRSYGLERALEWRASHSGSWAWPTCRRPPRWHFTLRGRSHSRHNTLSAHTTYFSPELESRI
jgi:hypothetical protein